MTSSDVIHSFYIPAFRSKMDVFPNRYTSFNFTAEQAGMEHEVFCAEYCGQKHSEMAAWIKVVTPEEYAAFKEEIGTVDPKADPATRGAYWWSRFGCRACHTTDGSPSTGPTWQNLWGYERSFTDGTSRVADHNYIRESVYDPKAQIREGYTPQMNSYQGLVSQEQLDDLIAFMQTLSDRGGPAPTEPEGAPDTSEPVRDLPTDAPLPEKDGEQ
jgi:cytochrome c oxidase subunit 2